MLRAYTGENHLLSDALLSEAARALAADEGDIYVVVPRQLTLLTERTLLSGLEAARLVSAARDRAGAPVCGDICRRRRPGRRARG